jgi:hypothetical protein
VIMTTIVGHLSNNKLEARYEAAAENRAIAHQMRSSPAGPRGVTVRRPNFVTGYSQMA